MKHCVVCEQETEEPDYYNSVEEINADLFGIKSIQTSSDSETSVQTKKKDPSGNFVVVIVILMLFSKVFAFISFDKINNGAVIKGVFPAALAVIFIVISTILAIFYDKNT